MKDYLRKYVWQLVSTILALVAIFAAYNVFFLGKPSKDLQVIIYPLVSLVDIKPEIVQDIQVSYKGKVVDKAYLAQFQIVNAGNQPIADTDYNRPLSFTFTAKYKLVDAIITSSEPENVGMSIYKSSDQEAVVSETLLNPGDKVTVRFILTRNESVTSGNDFDIDGRILGVREIKQVYVDQQLSEMNFFKTGLVIGAFLAIMVFMISDVIITAIVNSRRKKSSS